MKNILFASAVVGLLIIVAAGHAMSVEKLLLVSDNNADFAVASAISSDINAAVVLTKWGSYNESVLSAIINASPRKVVIIGGKAAVPETYIDALKNAGIDVKVVGGKTRQETSIEAYKEFKKELKKKPIVVAGMAPIAVRDAVPIYLYRGKAEIREFVKNLTKEGEEVESSTQEEVRQAELNVTARVITREMVERLHTLIDDFKVRQENVTAVPAPSAPVNATAVLAKAILGKEVSELVKQHGAAIRTVAAPSVGIEPATVSSGKNKTAG